MSIFNYLLDKFTTVRGQASTEQIIIDYEDNSLSSGKYSYFQDESVKDSVSEVMQNVTIIDVDVLEDSKIMDSPVESGILISDHRIFNPLEITVNCTLPASDWEDTYKEIRYWFERKDTGFLTIVTKAGVYRNMQLIGLPHKENSDTVSRLFFELHFRSVLFREFLYIKMPLAKVEKPQDSSTVDTGSKQPVTVKYNTFDYGNILNNSTHNPVPSGISFSVAPTNNPGYGV